MSSTSCSYFILGLGNPGKKYSLTRHNLGSILVNGIAHNKSIEFSYTEKYQAELAFYKSRNSFVVLLKSSNYINKTNISISKILCDYYISTNNLIVVHDDIDFEFGKFKITENGNSNHNAIKSLIKEIGTDSFVRLKIGVGRPLESFDIVEHVLGELSNFEQKLLNKLISECLVVIDNIVRFGVKSSMNKFNGKENFLGMNV